MTPDTAEEATEREYLAETLRLLAFELDELNGSIDSSARTIRAHKEHMWDNRRDMDFAEKATFRSEVDISVMLGERAVLTRERVKRLLDSPYFGRVDFRRAEGEHSAEFYIGVHNFFDPETQEIRVHDWRAPISSLYYDFEAGTAFVDTPSGRIDGDITAKRQYKIENGTLQFMFDSALNIGDDILQRELSESTDNRMKNIVATIQREQNAMIRNETAKILILQGVAGSGKTSIALHRVAFLLYRFKDTLSSDNVMILSPNRIFGDYIANVLPELGEERIAETDFSKIAHSFLHNVTEYETFDEQVSSLLEGAEPDSVERMRFKSTPEFVGRLDSWIAGLAAEFVSSHIEQKFRHLSAEWVDDIFDQSKSLPMFARLDRVANTAVQVLKNQVLDSGGKWAASDTAGVRRQVRAMFPYKSALAIYKDSYADAGLEKFFAPMAKKKIEYADVFPLIYVMIGVDRYDGFGRIQHLLVDEMQDYTPVQYAVLRRLFSCRMTILGDSNQSVNPFSSSSLSTIHAVFPEADCLELRKSYRSTTEITEFAQTISPNPHLIPIERHGERPAIHACSDDAAHLSRIVALVEDHERQDLRSLGIICKTVPQATALHRVLTESGVSATLLDYGSTTFTEGIVVTSAHISKGLEFDSVIVPSVDEHTYSDDDMDRCMLYIACTRAMHRLRLTHVGALSPLLADAERTFEPAATP